MRWAEPERRWAEPERWWATETEAPGLRFLSVSFSLSPADSLCLFQGLKTERVECSSPFFSSWMLKTGVSI